jgi:hypothetical protein
MMSSATAAAVLRRSGQRASSRRYSGWNSNAASAAHNSAPMKLNTTANSAIVASTT